MTPWARTVPLVLLLAAVSTAQQDATGEIRKKMDEISSLMRESERLLLELSKVDRLVASQRAIEEKLKELENAAPPEGAAAAEREREKRSLEERQDEIKKRLDDLMQGQQRRGEELVRSIEELLRSLPRSSQPSPSGSSGQEPRPAAGERDPPESPEEKKQRTGEGEEQKGDRRERKPGEKKPPDDLGSPENLRRAEAWIAHLPPEDQERIRRGDISHVPARYRSFIEAYTIARARRESAGGGESK